jgi:hypothetical protein
VAVVVFLVFFILLCHIFVFLRSFLLAHPHLFPSRTGNAKKYTKPFYFIVYDNPKRVNEENPYWILKTYLSKRSAGADEALYLRVNASWTVGSVLW